MEQLKKIKLIVSDFDGVMTNNKVLVDEDGKEAVFCNRADGLAVEILKKQTDIEMLVLSKEQNKVVQARCDKLKIKCVQSTNNKFQILQDEIKKRNLKNEQVCFVGNDINDIECLKEVGFAAVSNDAYPETKKVAHYIAKKGGGEGVIREIIDLILKK